MPPLLSHARVVIIGGGVVGCSILFHLARMGWKEVVLLERGGVDFGFFVARRRADSHHQFRPQHFQTAGLHHQSLSGVGKTFRAIGGSSQNRRFLSRFQPRASRLSQTGTLQSALHGIGPGICFFAGSRADASVD